MSDLISRQALLEKEWLTEAVDGYPIRVVEVGDIFDAPTIDAKPVVHAYWKPLKVYPDEFVCSNCGELWNDVKTPYCHECGARMDADPGDKKQA